MRDTVGEWLMFGPLYHFVFWPIDGLKKIARRWVRLALLPIAAPLSFALFVPALPVLVLAMFLDMAESFVRDILE